MTDKKISEDYVDNPVTSPTGTEIVPMLDGAGVNAGGLLSVIKTWVLNALGAVSVAITDTGGYFSGTTVEAALQELGAAVGIASIATDLAYTSSSTTTDSDPGTGVVRWNNATQASATFLYIDDADADSTSLATLWAGLPSGSYVRITKADDADVWQLWKLTSAPVDGTGYRKLAVSLQAAEGGNIANAVALLISVDAGGSGSSAVRYTKGAGWSGASVAISVPVDTIYVVAHATGTIQRATALGGGGPGSCSVEVWKTTYSSALPTVSDKISASAPITISSASKSQDSTLTGWTTSVTAGDILAFKLASVSTFTWLSVTLEIE